MFTRMVPWALPGCLFTCIIGLVVLRQNRMVSPLLGPLETADAYFVVLYLAWILAELGISKRDASDGSSSSDRHTRELYAISQASTILSALGLGRSHLTLSINACVGFGVFLGGVAFRLWAIHTLGRFYSHAVRTLDDHRLVADGPYRLVRHPAYAGMLLAHVGVVVSYFHFVPLAILMAALLPSVLIRILHEERVLTKIDGYAEFCASRARLVPFLW